MQSELLLCGGPVRYVVELTLGDGATQPMDGLRDAGKTVLRHLFTNLMLGEAKDMPSIHSQRIVTAVILFGMFGVGMVEISVCLNIHLAVFTEHGEIESIPFTIDPHPPLPFG